MTDNERAHGSTEALSNIYIMNDDDESNEAEGSVNGDGNENATNETESADRLNEEPEQGESIEDAESNNVEPDNEPGPEQNEQQNEDDKVSFDYLKVKLKAFLFEHSMCCTQMCTIFLF